MIDLLDPDRPPNDRHDFVLIFQLDAIPSITKKLYVHKAVLRSSNLACPMLVPPDNYVDRESSTIILQKPLFDVSQMLVEGIYRNEIRFSMMQFPPLYQLADCYTRHPNQNLVDYLQKRFNEMAECGNIHEAYESAMQINGCYPALSVLRDFLVDKVGDLECDNPIVTCGDLMFWKDVLLKLTTTTTEDTVKICHLYLSDKGIDKGMMNSFVLRSKSLSHPEICMIADQDCIRTIAGEYYFNSEPKNSESSILLCHAIAVISSAHSTNSLDLLNSLECKGKLLSYLCKFSSISDINNLRSITDPDFFHYLSDVFINHSWNMMDKHKVKIEKMNQTINKCNRLFRKCKMSVIYHLKLSQCEPHWLTGDYLLRGWFDSGPVYMLRERVDLQDQSMRHLKSTTRAVVFRYECTNDETTDRRGMPEWVKTDDQNQRTRKRAASTDHTDPVFPQDLKYYCWVIAVIHNNCDNPSSCQCILHSIENIVCNENQEQGDLLLFHARTTDPNSPPRFPKYWESVEGKTGPWTDVVCVPSIPNEFHKTECLPIESNEN
jgi:hypothetical protein